MAEKKKPKPITREELAGMSHKELASVKTKRRLMASIPEAPAKPEKPAADDETLTPRQRMERGHRRNEETASGGDDDGDN